MASFTLTRQIAADPERVFDTITDHRRYPEFTPLRRAELERPGESEPNGEGAIRALHLAGPPMRERVLAYRRPQLFTYELLSGLPVRDHVGTRMTYAIETTPTVPVVGFAVVGAMRLAISRLMAGVAREAERPA